MGVAISFRFLSGRYSATPWDRNPNEGVAEWPPAPWRVLRAIVAAAYRADGDPDRDRMATILHALSGAPRYRLPIATAAHTRSYQPLFDFDHKTGRQRTALVLDAFVVVGRGARDDEASVILEWPMATLDDASLVSLDRWLEALGYLGRAESWVEASRTTVRDGDASVEPAHLVQHPASVLRLLAPAEADATSLMDSLLTDTNMLYKRRLADPPNTRWQEYAFREPAFASPPHRARRATPAGELPTIVRLALGTRVGPRLIDAVRFGDRVRTALMARSRRSDGLPHPIFAGKSATGVPLADNAHAHVLPLDENRDGAIDHVILWAPGGFDPSAMEAIMDFNWLWGDGGFDIRVAYTGAGGGGDSLQKLGVPSAWHEGSAAAVATRWRSRTPFVLTRHPKVRGGVLRDSPEQQVRREFTRLGLPDVISLQPTTGTDAPTHTAWHRFRLSRTTGGGSRGGDRGYGFAVEFAHPVSGPVAVGYGARQGLGQFEPVP